MARVGPCRAQTQKDQLKVISMQLRSMKALFAAVLGVTTVAWTISAQEPGWNGKYSNHLITPDEERAGMLDTLRGKLERAAKRRADEKYQAWKSKKDTGLHAERTTSSITGKSTHKFVSPSNNQFQSGIPYAASPESQQQYTDQIADTIPSVPPVATGGNIATPVLPVPPHVATNRVGDSDFNLPNPSSMETARIEPREQTWNIPPATTDDQFSFQSTPAENQIPPIGRDQTTFQTPLNTEQVKSDTTNPQITEQVDTDSTASLRYDPNHNPFSKSDSDHLKKDTQSFVLNSESKTPADIESHDSKQSSNQFSTHSVNESSSNSSWQNPTSQSGTQEFISPQREMINSLPEIPVDDNSTDFLVQQQPSIQYQQVESPSTVTPTQPHTNQLIESLPNQLTTDNPEEMVSNHSVQTQSVPTEEMTARLKEFLAKARPKSESESHETQILAKPTTELEETTSETANPGLVIESSIQDASPVTETITQTPTPAHPNESQSTTDLPPTPETTNTFKPIEQANPAETIAQIPAPAEINQEPREIDGRATTELPPNPETEIDLPPANEPSIDLPAPIESVVELPPVNGLPPATEPTVELPLQVGPRVQEEVSIPSETIPSETVVDLPPLQKTDEYPVVEYVESKLPPQQERGIADLPIINERIHTTNNRLRSRFETKQPSNDAPRGLPNVEEEGKKYNSIPRGSKLSNLLGKSAPAAKLHDARFTEDPTKIGENGSSVLEAKRLEGIFHGYMNDKEQARQQSNLQNSSVLRKSQELNKFFNSRQATQSSNPLFR